MSTLKTTSRKSDEFTKEADSPRALYPDVSIQKASNDIYEDGTIDPVYQAKSRLLNTAIQEIGMGRYQVRRVLVQSESYLRLPPQWYLFIVAGFGWFAYVHYSLKYKRIIERFPANSVIAYGP